MTGTIFDIADFSTQDGPGIRTVIFFKGCPLSCWWCSNPESQHFFPEPLYHAELCRKCYNCVKVCPQKAVNVTDGYRIERSLCQNCLDHPCTKVCPEDALTLAGKQWSIAEVMEKILPQRSYYQNTGGGVTFSGGEPMAQPDFAFAMAARIKEEGFNLGLETCGYFANTIDFERFKLFDFVFFDLKHHDSTAHKIYTGKSNSLIEKNLKTLCQHVKPESITLSLPVIPSINNQELFFAWAAALANKLGISKARLLPYHEFGRSKYQSLGREYCCRNLPVITNHEYRNLASELESKGILCEIVGINDAKSKEIE